jgi:hypothetical protein
VVVQNTFQIKKASDHHSLTLQEEIGEICTTRVGKRKRPVQREGQRAAITGNQSGKKLSL